jgi:eukaryotic-like serine/threonine-protein kinase
VSRDEGPGDTVPLRGAAGDGDALGETLAAPSDPFASTLAPPSDPHAATLPAPRRSAELSAPSQTGLIPVDPQLYELGDEVARGGMGRVRRATDRRIGRHVAIKELLADDAELRLRFEREARVTGQLQHPSIVPVYEVGRWPNGQPFYAMKLVAGRPLDEVVDEALDANTRLALIPRLVPAVEAIAYAHEQGVMHRDLKPSNILLGDFGETVVIDWGLAKGIDETEPSLTGGDFVATGGDSGALTVAGSVLGTPAYMAPEQARGEAVDARADVYALGALLYHALSGRPPFDGDDARAIVAAVMIGPPAPLQTIASETPADLVGIVEKAMARDPLARYPDARELARDLTAFSTGGLVAAYHYSSWDLLTRFVRRNRAASAATALLVLVSVVGAVAVVQAYRDSERERARAVSAEHEALVAERASHERLAQIHWRSAVRRLQDGDHLGAEVLAAAALLQQPANPRGPFHALGSSSPLSEAERAPVLAGPAATWFAARELRFASRGRRMAGHRDWIYDIVSSADGAWVVTAAADHAVLIWDRASAEPVRRLEGHTKTVFQLALRKDGKQLASSSYDGTVRLWSLPEGTPGRILKHPAGRAYGLCYASDGHVLAIGLGGELARFDPKTGRLVGTHELTSYLPWRLDCAAEDPVGVLGTSGPEAVVFDTSNGRPVHRLPHGDTRVLGAVVMPDGQHVVTADKQGILRRFDRESGRELAQAHLGGSFGTLARSRDGRWLALGAEDLQVVDASTLRPVARLRAHTSAVVALGFAPRGDRLYSGGLDQHVVEWLIPATRSSMTLMAPTVSEVDTSRVSPDGRKLVTGGDDNTVRLWDLQTGRLQHTFDAHKAPVRGLRFLDDGHIATSGMDRKLYVHDLTTFRSTLAAELPHFGDEISVFGDRVAVGSGDGAVLLFERGSWDRQVIAKVHEARSWWVGFSPDGKQLASASFSGGIAMIDPASQQVVRGWKGHEGRIYAAAWHPDGATFTTADLKGWVRQWDPASGEARGQWRVLGGERIYSIAWSADGEQLLLATADGMRLYLRDGTLVARIDIGAHTTGVTWTHDRRMVFAAAGQIHVMPVDQTRWRDDPTQLLAEAEAAAGASLAALLGLE